MQQNRNIIYSIKQKSFNDIDDYIHNTFNISYRTIKLYKIIGSNFIKYEHLLNDIDISQNIYKLEYLSAAFQNHNANKEIILRRFSNLSLRAFKMFALKNFTNLNALNNKENKIIASKLYNPDNLREYEEKIQSFIDDGNEPLIIECEKDKYIKLAVKRIIDDAKFHFAAAKTINDPKATAFTISAAAAKNIINESIKDHSVSIA